MIPKDSKFPLRTDFLRFRTLARKVVTPHITCYLSPTPTPKLAVIIPKKLHKLATVRNWLKRLVYDALWPLLEPQKLSCVVVFKPLPLKKSLSTKTQIISELQKAFSTT